MEWQYQFLDALLKLGNTAAILLLKRFMSQGKTVKGTTRRVYKRKQPKHLHKDER
jgi:hypothetical protein